jgi:hypothetical protein
LDYKTSHLIKMTPEGKDKNPGPESSGSSSVVEPEPQGAKAFG